jgi:hypothetical protein
MPGARPFRLLHLKRSLPEAFCCPEIGKNKHWFAPVRTHGKGVADGLNVAFNVPSG